jgi:hypothetical protein
MGGQSETKFLVSIIIFQGAVDVSRVTRVVSFGGEEAIGYFAKVALSEERAQGPAGV